MVEEEKEEKFSRKSRLYRRRARGLTEKQNEEEGCVGKIGCMEGTLYPAVMAGEGICL